MKPKDLVALLAAVGILLVAGYIVVTQVLPKPAVNTEADKVEVVGDIQPDFDSTALSRINDAEKVRNFAAVFDLTVDLNNGAVFGP